MASAPTPLTAIAISGTAVVDHQLTAELTPVDATAAYQWQICDTVNGVYEDISDATDSTYTPVQADLGKFIRVVAKGTDSYGGSVTSAATAAVATPIYSLEDLYAINESLSGNYVLMQDLDFTESASYSSGSVNAEWIAGGTGWTPIGTFTGMLDGNGHTISNLFICSNSGSLGLFSSLSSSGTVKNLGLLNVSITGTGGSNIGAFAGCNFCLIKNCYATGIIISAGDQVGGIAGSNDDGTITACSSSVTVTGGSMVGGISGKGGLNNSVPLIEDCYSTGSVTGANYVGGLLGYGPTARIVRSYAVGAVAGLNDVGGLAGYYDDSGYPAYTYLQNSYALNPSVTLISGSATTIGRIAGAGSSANITGCFGNQAMTIPSSNSGINGTDITLENAKLIASYSAWVDNIDTTSGSNTDSVWVIDNGNSLPRLRGGYIDDTAPVLSSTSASPVTGNSAVLNFTTDEAGVYYYLVYAAADTAPDAATIKAQGAAVAKGTSSAAWGANSVSVSGLTASTAYKAYLIVEDAAGNVSTRATIEFTTGELQLGDLSLGDVVKDTNSWDFKLDAGYTGTAYATKPVEWIVVAKNHSGYPDDSVTLVSTELIAKYAFDSNNSNYWGTSGLRTWLNGDFYNSLSPYFRDQVLTTTLENKDYTGAAYTSSDKVFIPSWTELGAGTAVTLERTYVIGTDWGYFASDASRIALLADGIAYKYWSRSPNNGGTSAVQRVGDGGKCENEDGASYAGDEAVRPVVNLNSTTHVNASGEISQ